MRIAWGAIIAVLVVTGGLAGCANKGLRDLRSNGEGPDEFMVMPNKPLTQPANFQDLPSPTPGGSNLVDVNPKAEAVVALGGRASALIPQGGIPRSEGALVTAASRYGVAPDIRMSLAESDAAFRKRQGRMANFRLFHVNRYNQAYRQQALDPYVEEWRFRRVGIATPTAPPRDE